MGKLIEPAELFRRVITIGDQWNDVPVQNAHRQLGSILFEWNRLDEVREHVTAVTEIAKGLDTPVQLPYAHALLASLAHADQQWDVALDEIERAIAICAANETFGSLQLFEEMKCRIWIATNQLTLAQAWLRQVGPDVIKSVRYEELPTTLTAIRVRILEERGHEIASSLEHLREVAYQRGWIRDLITIQSLRAIVESDRGNMDSAQAAIEDALGLGAPEGFRRTYLLEGPQILPVLRLAARQDGPQREHAIAVLAAAGEVALSSVPKSARAPSILSNRERDVVRLVANGLSNKAIADTLFISEETVKTHLRRIFEKLDASSRTQVIHKAQQLGLL
jgi:LuxR family maltose regulon positive regulatory protein